jgi:hypothetical protein
MHQRSPSSVAAVDMAGQVMGLVPVSTEAAPSAHSVRTQDAPMADAAVLVDSDEEESLMVEAARSLERRFNQAAGSREQGTQTEACITWPRCVLPRWAWHAYVARRIGANPEPYVTEQLNNYACRYLETLPRELQVALVTILPYLPLAWSNPSRALEALCPGMLALVAQPLPSSVDATGPLPYLGTF